MVLVDLVQCSFVEQRNYKVIYRRYASLFFIVGVDGSEVCPDGAFQQFQHTFDGKLCCLPMKCMP